jgi:hypothetical protein
MDGHRSDAWTKDLIADGADHRSALRSATRRGVRPSGGGHGTEPGGHDSPRKA